MDLPELLTDRLRALRPPTAGPPRLPGLLDRASEAWWGRTPVTRWVAVGLVAVAGLAIVGRGATRSPWGSPTPVLVAAADLTAGTDLAAAAVEATSWPEGLVPADALAVPDGRLVAAVPAGQVLTVRHVAPDLAALVPAGDVAVPVPVDGLPHVTPGQVVDVVASGTDGVGRVLADHVAVLAAEDGWLWLAVPETAAGQVSAAATGGRLGLALRRPAQGPAP